MIVVIDTNVWLSALLSSGRGGKPGLAIEKAILEGTIATCSQMEEEALRVLSGKFGLPMESAAIALDALVPFPLRVKVQGTLHVCRDPDDDMVLECAVVAGAHIIITGDKDLLVLGHYRGIQIVTPADFLTLGA